MKTNNTLTSKIVVLFLCCFSLSSISFAQLARCGQAAAMKTKSQNYLKAVDQTYEKALRAISQKSLSRSKEVLTVPVVVHVVYNKEVENISDDLILSQIEVLNQDFQRMNADTGTARGVYQLRAGNPDIQFVLADTDPAGNPTTGITRTSTEIETFFDLDIPVVDILAAADSCNVDPADPMELWDSLYCFQNALLGTAILKNDAKEDPIQLDDVKNTARGGVDPWDTQRYINIWVCNLNIRLDGQSIPGLLGYAYPPVEAPNWPTEDFPENIADLEGVVLSYAAIGVDNPNITPDLVATRKGRTCTHEMGHYFGLRHTSGDGTCGSDDGLVDTPSEDAIINPIEFGEIVTCTSSRSIDTCTEEDFPDLFPDMIENYMSYSLQTCQNLFTQDQVGIMRTMLEGPRSGLLGGQITSTSTRSINKLLTVYPNPTNDVLSISMTGYPLTDFEVSIENLMGQEVLHQPATPVLSVGGLTAGIYMVRLKNEEIEAIQKIVINRN